MLRAIIFDFDGILVDSEPLIMTLIQEMAAREGWLLSEEEYFRDYLALDDRGVIDHLWRTHGRTLGIARRNETSVFCRAPTNSCRWSSSTWSNAFSASRRPRVPGPRVTASHNPTPPMRAP